MGQKASWELNKEMLSVAMPEGGKAEFDLSRIWPDFEGHTEVQQYLESYGVKQNLSDTTARNKDVALTEEEKVKTMIDKFEDLVAGKIRARTGGVSIKKKLDTAKENATPEELAVLRKLGLIA